MPAPSSSPRCCFKFIADGRGSVDPERHDLGPLTVETVFNFVPEKENADFFSNLTNYTIFSHSIGTSDSLKFASVAAAAVSGTPRLQLQTAQPKCAVCHCQALTEDTSATNLKGTKNLEPGALWLPTHTIAKPCGQVTRLGRGGYSLRAELGWNRGLYKSIQTRIGFLARQHLKLGITLKKQKPAKIIQVCNEAAREFEILKRYDGDWVTLDFLTIFLRNTVAHK